MSTPKWLTPERADILRDVVEKWAGKCLKGHLVSECDDAIHYQRPKATTLLFEIPMSQNPRDGLTVPLHPTVGETKGWIKPPEGGPFIQKVESGRVVHSVALHGRGTHVTGAFAGANPVTIRGVEERDHAADFYVQDMIDYWKEQDRADAKMERWAESHQWAPDTQMNTGGISIPIFSKKGTLKSVRRTWDAVDRDVHNAGRRINYQLVYVGVNPATGGMVAKVRIPGTPVELHVKLPAKEKPSKNALRKLTRYGAGPLKPVMGAAHEKIEFEVRRYWQTR